MKDSEFIQKRSDRGKIGQTCHYIETGAHKLLLMSRRQHMTVTELRAQAKVLQQWLTDLEGYLATEPDNQEVPTS
jgi:hypothetical protein